MLKGEAAGVEEGGNGSNKEEEPLISLEFLQ
jgi:hypothetical protein